MSGNRNKKSLILTAAAVALVGSLSVGSALAYFTTYCAAEGSVQLDMGFSKTVIHEEVKDGKHITVENVGDYDCFVRAKAYAPSPVGEKLTYSAPEGGWTAGEDGYWYYDAILPSGSATSELLVQYTLPVPPEGELTEDEWNQWQVNIIVVQECTPVVYGEDGTPYGDWNYVITSAVTE